MGSITFLFGHKNDEKYTPQYAVLPIIKYLPKDKIIWCPFDTRNSEFVTALKEVGYKVVFSHIHTGQDFFDYEPDKWDIIISNPPYSGKRQVFEHCLDFDKPFALLMTTMWLNDIAPCLLFKDKDLQLLLFDKRIDFGFTEKKAPFGAGYFCRNLLPKQIVFENLNVVKGQKSRMYQDFI